MIPSPSATFTAVEASTVSIPAFRVTLDPGGPGEHVIPEAKIVDPGAITQDRPVDFSDLVSSDHSLVLMDTDGSYCPNHAGFIWSGQVWWLRGIKVELAYRWHPGQTLVDDDYATLYEGSITEWQATEVKDHTWDAPAEGVQVIITSRGRIAVLAQRRIGEPDDEGEPNPVVFGQVLKHLSDYGDRRSWTPDVEENFGEGTAGTFTAVTSGNGAVSFIYDTPPPQAAFDYSAHCTVSTQSSNAHVRSSDLGGQAKILASAWLKFNIPTMQNDHDFYFLNFLGGGAANLCGLTVDKDGYIEFWNGVSGYAKGSWSVKENPNTWVYFSVLFNRTNNLLRVFVDHAEVLSTTAVAASPSYVFWGFQTTIGDITSYEMWVADCKIDYTTVFTYPYYLPGAPYDSIDEVYINGIQVSRYQQFISPATTAYIDQQRKQFYASWKGAYRYPYDNYATYPAYGVVDLFDNPSGSVLGLFTHDTHTHPADIILQLMGPQPVEECVNSGCPDMTDWVDTNEDGIADSWDAQWGGTPAIVTGNGFSGNAQRLAGNVSNQLCQWASVAPAAGRTYRVTMKYRSDVAFWCKNAYSTQYYKEIPANPGDAKAITFTFTTTTDKGTLSFGFGASGWFEVDEVSCKEWDPAWLICDADNFADVEDTIDPDTAIGCYFESVTLAEAVAEVMAMAMYDLVERRGLLCLIPYTGVPPASPVKTLDRGNCHSFAQDLNMDDIITGCTVKWGFYEMSASLFYRRDDADLKALLGDMTKELDFSYGADVATADGATAQAKADLYLRRLGGAIDNVVAGGSLALARLEIGDPVALLNAPLGIDNDYEVISKTVDLTNLIVEIAAARYAGESRMWPDNAVNRSKSPKITVTTS